MRWLAGSAASLLLLAAPAGAATITVTFSGTVSFVATQLEDFFDVGDPVSGSFEIDSDTADLLPADPVLGLYPGAASDFAFDFGGYLASSNVAGGTQVRVENDAMGTGPFDRFIASKTCNSTCTAATLDIWSLVGMTFLVSDSTAAAFSDDSIPESLDLADFGQRSASLEFVDPERTAGPTVSATLTPWAHRRPGSPRARGRFRSRAHCGWGASARPPVRAPLQPPCPGSTPERAPGAATSPQSAATAASSGDPACWRRGRRWSVKCSREARGSAR